MIRNVTIRIICERAFVLMLNFGKRLLTTTWFFKKYIQIPFEIFTSIRTNVNSNGQIDQNHIQITALLKVCVASLITHRWPCWQCHSAFRSLQTAYSRYTAKRPLSETHAEISAFSNKASQYWSTACTHWCSASGPDALRSGRHGTIHAT